MLISDPLASPYFLPTAARAAALLGATLPALLPLEGRRPRPAGGGVLLRRWCVWAVIGPAFALALLSGPATTLLLTGLMVGQGLREYARLVGLPPVYARGLPLLGLLAPALALLSPEAFSLLPPALFLLGTLQPLLWQREGGAVRHLAFAALGWGWIAWLLAHLLLVYQQVAGGPGILLVVGLGTALSDVGAFTLGKTLGRHRLAPRLSPHKTWEGALGNLLGAIAGVAITAFALPPAAHPALLLALPPVIAVGALWGDLFESSIKREFGARDAGAWLPGFGGLLDRVDSLIVVVPLVYYLLRLLQAGELV